MAKLKTHKGAAKRMRITKTGKVLRNKAYKSHLLTKKGRSRKRKLGKKALVSKANIKKAKRMLVH